jgi:hypothetical protein
VVGVEAGRPAGAAAEVSSIPSPLLGFQMSKSLVRKVGCGTCPCVAFTNKDESNKLMYGSRINYE